MSLSELLLDGGPRAGLTARIAGVVVAVVTNTQDPEGLARVKLRYPWLSDQDESPWARIACPMAGASRGTYFLPEVDDEVLVAFEQGDVRLPYVVGALWNGKDLPPAKNEDGKNDVRMIKSRSGHVVRLNDKDGGETIEIVDKTGKNSLVVDTARNTVTISSDKDIVLAAANGTITLDAQQLVMKSAKDAALEAGGKLALKSAADGSLQAGGGLVLKGATVDIN
jgi:uncharacterized protein involved in type VI secretion and phage assembly